MPDEIYLDSLVSAYDAFQAFEERCFTLLHAIADLPQPESDFQRRLMHTALAKLGTGHDMDDAVNDIGWVNEQPDEGNMFVWHVNIDAYLRFGHLYPPELSDIVEMQLTSHGYEIHDGQTENHKLMIAVAGYLVAQTWPEWLLADETVARMDAYLNAFFDRVVRFGQGEFDSPTYSVLYLNSLATLFDFTLDPRMRRKAAMMLDWFLANMAGEWLDGLLVGAHSRDSTPTAGSDDATGGRAVGWLYFGGQMPDFERGEPHYAVINALSGYRMPEVIAHMAQDRDHSFVHLETHDLMSAGQRSHDGNPTHRLDAERQGFGYIAKGGVYKTTYVTPGFALGSMVDGKQGDVLWAGHLRRWSLTWLSQEPAGVLFFTHPFPDGPGDKVYRELWRGSSPYEQVLQHEGVLIAVYSIPEGGTYKYAPRDEVPSDRDAFIEGFFPKAALYLVEEDPSGWIFAHGGSVLIAVRPLCPYTWLEGEDIGAELGREVRPPARLHSPGLKNGVILEAVSPDDFEDPDAPDPAVTLAMFRDAVLARTSVDACLDQPAPSVVYTTLQGDRLEITYDGARTINGEPVDFHAWPVIRNPYAESLQGTGVLSLRYGENRRILDYNTWCVQDCLV